MKSPRPPLRILRIIGWVFLSLLVLIVAGMLIEQWRGKSAWQNCKAALEAKGEHLDIAAFIPPSIPDDQNFAMAPLLKPLLDYTRDPVTLDMTLKEPDAPVYKLNFEIIRESSSTGPKLTAWMTGNPWDLRKWADYYRTLKDVPYAESSAEKVLAALSRFDAMFAGLRKESARRPLSRFPVKYQDGVMCALPHCGVLQNMVKVLAARAVAELDAKRNDDAFADVEFGFRLADSIRNEPTLISQLVRISMTDFLIQPIWEGIASHRWSDAQLARLQEQLQRLDYLADYALAMRAERAGQNWIFDSIRSDPRWLSLFVGLDEKHVFLLRATRTAFSGWLYQNQAFENVFMQEYVLPVIDPSQHRAYLETAKKASDRMKNPGFLPYTMMARIVMPVYESIAVKFSLEQTYVDEAIIACAIERYRIAHGALPAALDDLKMPALPRDIITGEPLHYQVTGEDYLLYSVGWNGTDDGGKVAVKNTDKTKPDPKQGDWVWSLKPL